MKNQISISIKSDALELLDDFRGAQARGLIIEELIYREYGNPKKKAFGELNEAVERARARGLTVQIEVGGV